MGATWVSDRWLVVWRRGGIRLIRSTPRFAQAFVSGSGAVRAKENASFYVAREIKRTTEENALK